MAQIQPLLSPLQKLKRKTIRALFRYDPSYTDMFLDKSEFYSPSPNTPKLASGMKAKGAAAKPYQRFPVEGEAEWLLEQ